MENLKTRAVLKSELLAKIPEGEETHFLKQAEQRLEEMQTRLQQLQEQRTTLRRGITIRERKLRDWKGKIPRVGDVPDNEQVLQTIHDMPSVSCVNIGEIDDKAEYITMGNEYARALCGLPGFGKIWLVIYEPDDDKDKKKIQPTLVLVDVVECNEKSGKIKVGGLDKQFCKCIVLDIKPYLSYCEALPSSDNNQNDA